MRATRAMIGSLGAGMTLAIASSVALLLVSSVVAFRGWPGAPAEPSVDNVAKLTDAGVVKSAAGKSAAVATLQLPSAATVSRTARHAVSGVHRSGTSSAAGTGADQASTTNAPSSASAPSTAAAPAATHESMVHHVVTQTGQHTADAVKQTTDTAAQAVAPVAPAAASTLEELGAAGSGAVQQVTTTAGKLVGG